MKKLIENLTILALVIRIVFFVLLLGSMMAGLLWPGEPGAFWMAWFTAIVGGVIDPAIGGAIRSIAWKDLTENNSHYGPPEEVRPEDYKAPIEADDDQSKKAIVPWTGETVSEYLDRYSGDPH